MCNPLQPQLHIPVIRYPVRPVSNKIEKVITVRNLKVKHDLTDRRGDSRENSWCFGGYIQQYGGENSWVFILPSIFVKPSLKPVQKLTDQELSGTGARFFSTEPMDQQKFLLQSGLTPH